METYKGHDYMREWASGVLDLTTAIQERLNQSPRIRKMVRDSQGYFRMASIVYDNIAYELWRYEEPQSLLSPNESPIILTAFTLESFSQSEPQVTRETKSNMISDLMRRDYIQIPYGTKAAEKNISFFRGYTPRSVKELAYQIRTGALNTR